MTEAERFTREEGFELIRLARKTIEAELFGDGGFAEEGMYAASKFRDKRGTFVTLTVNGTLRGCIGHIIPSESVLEGVKKNALNAAFEDPRFRPLTAEEWDKVRVEVSILSDPRPLVYETPEELLNSLKPGVDGVIIRKGARQSTFLPQVWEQLPDKNEFLTHLCLKAGLDGDAWRKGGLEVFTYEVQAFED
jgi:AmmeMemoRadiSam system protein A